MIFLKGLDGFPPDYNSDVTYSGCAQKFESKPKVYRALSCTFQFLPLLISLH